MIQLLTLDFRTFTSSSSLTRTAQDPPPTQQAQVTVLVAMPSPHAHSPDAAQSDYAIGTRQVVYKGDELKEKAQAEVYEVPIMLDLCAHGYMV